MRIQVRASSWSELFDCPKRWAAIQLDGQRLPTTIEAHIGTAIHAGTAFYDGALALGLMVSADMAVEKALHVLQHPEEVPDTRLPLEWGTLTPAQAATTVRALVALYCERWATRTRYRFVELQVRPLVVPFADIEIELTGTLDRVREERGRYGVDDLKTGGRAVYASGHVDAGKHKLQLGVYELLLEHTLGTAPALPARVVALRTKGEPLLGSAEVTGAKALVEGDRQSWGALEHGARLIAAGDFYGNPRSQLCSKKFCPVWGDCRWRQ